MASGTITKRAVDAQVPGAADSFLWDSEIKGFGLKVTRGGARSYIYQYRLGGREAKVRRLSIGAHGTWTPDLARKEARRLAQLVDQGVDPAAEAAKLRREKVDLAFPAYAERFIAEYLRVEWKGGYDLAAGILRLHIVPALRRKSVRDITRGDISNLMDGLAKSPATRRNAFAVLRRLFRWAVNRGDLEASPARDMDPPPAPPSRDRVLSDVELSLVWKAAVQAGYPFGTFALLLILTGQRREEIAGLAWNELDREKQLWTLPAARAKNGVAHDVPLSGSVIAILDAIAQRQRSTVGSSEWPSSGFLLSATGENRVTGYSNAKKRLDRLMVEVNMTETGHKGAIPAWRYHDLRRTLATGLQRLGVRFEVTEAVLNHVSGSRAGVAGVYQRHHWSNEKRAALNAWADHVACIVG